MQQTSRLLSYQTLWHFNAFYELNHAPTDLTVFIKFFVNLKSKSALFSNEKHNLLRVVFPSNNTHYRILPCFILLTNCNSTWMVVSKSQIMLLIKSLVPQACKQGIKSKAGAIKCCEENKITYLPNEWGNTPFCLTYQKRKEKLGTGLSLWHNS